MGQALLGQKEKNSPKNSYKVIGLDVDESLVESLLEELSQKISLRLIPSQLHSLDTFKKTWAWRRKHSKKFNWSTETVCLINSSSLQTLETQLKSLIVQTSSAWKARVYLDSQILAEAEEILERFNLSSKVEIFLKEPGETYLRELDSVVEESRSSEANLVFLDLGEKSCIHPFSIELLSRDLTTKAAACVYTNQCFLLKDRPEEHFLKTASDKYSLLGANWAYGSFVFTEELFSSHQKELRPLIEALPREAQRKALPWLLSLFASVKPQSELISVPLSLFSSISDSRNSSCLEISLRDFHRAWGEMLAPSLESHLGTTFVYSADSSTGFIPQSGKGSCQVIIPFKDESEVTKKCLDSLLGQSIASELQVTLVSNNSSSSELSKIKSYSESLDLRTEVIENQDYFNFAALNNQGAKSSDSEFVLMLNNDVELVETRSLEYLRAWASLPDVGFVGGRLVYPNGKTQHGGIVFASVRPANCQLESQFIDYFREVDAVSFAMAMCRRSVWTELGGLDELSCSNGYGDALVCHQARLKGYRNLYVSDAVATHYESLSRGRSLEDVELLDLVEAGVEIGSLQDELVLKRSPKVLSVASTKACPEAERLFSWIRRRPKLISLINSFAGKALNIRANRRD